MSIHIDCVECGQRMVDGLLQHTKECSANLSEPVIGTDYLRLPGQVISFDTPADRKRFEKNLVGGTGLQLTSPDTKPKVTSKAHTNSPSPIEEPLDKHAEYYIKETMKFFQENGESPALSKNNRGDSEASAALLEYIDQGLKNIEESTRQHTVPEGKHLVTRSYVLNAIEFERKRFGIEK